MSPSKTQGRRGVPSFGLEDDPRQRSRGHGRPLDITHRKHHPVQHAPDRSRHGEHSADELCFVSGDASSEEHANAHTLLYDPGISLMGEEAVSQEEITELWPAREEITELWSAKGDTLSPSGAPSDLAASMTLLASMRRSRSPSELMSRDLEIVSLPSVDMSETHESRDSRVPRTTLAKEKRHSHRHSHRKRHRRSEWDEHVSQEVTRLKHHNSLLEGLLEEAGLAQQALEEENQNSQQHRVELERLVHEGVACGSVAIAIGENGELRKQLAAYAVEIDVLRKENEELERSLTKAKKEVERTRIHKEELDYNHREASRAMELSEDTLKQQTGNHAAQIHSKGLQIGALMDLAEELQRALSKSYEVHVAQTSEYSNFAKEVRRQQLEAKQILEEANGAANQNLDASVQGLFKMDVLHKDALGTIDELKAKKQRVARPPAAELGSIVEWWKDATHNSGWKEVLQAREGLLLEKVDRAGKRFPRRVFLKTERTQNGFRKDFDRVMMSLCWERPLEEGQKPPLHRRIVARIGTNQTELDLKEVIRVDYGSTTRSCVLHDNVNPWHCFSLYTAQRSYDFVCNSDDDTRCLVLATSRMCNWAAGAIRSRQAFESKKGWCKVNEYCFRVEKTLGFVFLEALRRAAASRFEVWSPGDRPRRAVADAERRQVGLSPASSRHRGSAAGVGL